MAEAAHDPAMKERRFMPTEASGCGFTIDQPFSAYGASCEQIVIPGFSPTQYAMITGSTREGTASCFVHPYIKV